MSVDNFKKSLVLNRQKTVRNATVGTAATLVAIEGAAMILQGKIMLEEENIDFKKELNEMVSKLTQSKEILTDNVINTDFTDITLQNNHLNLTKFDNSTISYDLLKCQRTSIFKDANGDIVSCYNKATQTLYVDGKTYYGVTEEYGTFKQGDTILAKFDSDFNTFQIGQDKPFYIQSDTGTINFIKDTSGNVVGIYDEKTYSIYINDSNANINLDNSILRDDLTEAKNSILDIIDVMKDNPKYNQELFANLREKVAKLDINNNIDILSYKDFSEKLIQKLDGTTNILSGKVGFSEVTEKINKLGIFDSLGNMVGADIASIIGLFAISSIIIASLTLLSAKTTENILDIYEDDLKKRKIITPDDIKNKDKNNKVKETIKK